VGTGFDIALSLHQNLTEIDYNNDNHTRLDEYWQVNQEPQTAIGDYWTRPGIEIVTFSSEVPSLSFVESFASAGIIGLCALNFFSMHAVFTY